MSIPAVAPIWDFHGFIRPVRTAGAAQVTFRNKKWRSSPVSIRAPCGAPAFKAGWEAVPYHSNWYILTTYALKSTLTALLCSLEHWRMGGDSNSRDPFGYTRFPSVRDRPLCHPSMSANAYFRVCRRSLTFGGSGGIRTHDTFRCTGLANLRLKPLGHASKDFGAATRTRTGTGFLLLASQTKVSAKIPP